VSPPPTTPIGLPRYSAPSQVAQAETPRLVYFASDSMPSHFADAPVATTTASASKRCVSVSTANGRSEKSIEVASSKITRVPKRSACFWNSSISSGPATPSGKPG
jgi:hypothetical protein